MTQSLIATIEELGLRGSLFLAALLAAQSRRIALAPTHRAALLLLDLLQDLGTIEVPWPAERWPVRPNAEFTPLESLQWEFSWASHQRQQLLPVLEDQLDELAQNPELETQRLRLWNELAMWEIEHFLEAQLGKHRFDPSWARDLEFVYQGDAQNLPIARWRYCCWAAVRQGAFVAQRQGTPDQSSVREAIFREIQRRLAYVAGATPGNGEFTPYHPFPHSAVAQLFVEHVMPMGWEYWTSERTPPI